MKTKLRYKLAVLAKSCGITDYTIRIFRGYNNIRFIQVIDKNRLHEKRVALRGPFLSLKEIYNW